MARVRDVLPDVVRLPLSDGDFLTVKKELNAGEYIDLLTDQAAGHYFAKQLAYLVGWTLVGHGGPLPYAIQQSVEERRATLRALDQRTAMEIVEAIKAHEAANERALEEKKTIRELAPIS